MLVDMHGQVLIPFHLASTKSHTSHTIYAHVFTCGGLKVLLHYAVFFDLASIITIQALSFPASSWKFSDSISPQNTDIISLLSVSIRNVKFQYHKQTTTTFNLCQEKFTICGIYKHSNLFQYKNLLLTCPVLLAT